MISNEEVKKLKMSTFIQSVLIFLSVDIAILSIVFNVYYNYPIDPTTKELWIWFNTKCTFIFIVLFVLLGICTLIITNFNGFSLRKILNIKNSIIGALTFGATLSTYFIFTAATCSKDLRAVLGREIISLCTVLILLFVVIGIFSLIILKSSNKHKTTELYLSLKLLKHRLDNI